MMRTHLRQRPDRKFRYSPLIAAFACAFGSQASLATTFGVFNANDSGAGSLRQAIADVNGRPDCLTTGGHFVEVVGGPFIVSLSSPLPDVTCANSEIKGLNNLTVYGGNLFTGACGLTGSATTPTKINDVIVKNFTYGGAGYGICGNVNATGNTVQNNTKGFYLTASGSTLSGNTITSNTYGVVETGGTTITNNNLFELNTNAIDGGDNTTVSSNTIRNNSFKGITLGANATITNNTITSNNVWGIRTMGAGAVIKGNTVSGHPSGSGIELVYGGLVGGPLAADRNFVYGNFYGIAIGSGVTVENNHVGINSGGSASANNYGIDVYSTIGGSNTIRNNLVSGNLEGITIEGNSANSVTGNIVGLNALGTAAVPNQYGITVAYTYGGPVVTVTDNVIAGNINYGIDLVSVQDVQISGNKLGTNALGNTAFANGKGIRVWCSSNISIVLNTVSGNSIRGMSINGLVNSQINSNLIGVGSDGVTQLPNTGPGIYLESADYFCEPQGSGNDFDPKVAGSGAKVLSVNTLSGNTVAYNTGDGIFIYGGTGNNITGGSIFANTGKNINLDYTGGPLPQNEDFLDGDTGPNNRQNYPVITGVTHNAGSTVIDFTLDSTANSTFSLDFYANPSAGSPAGATFIGTKTGVVTHLTTGNVAGQAIFTGTFSFVSATATGTDGTSEFSLMSTAAITPAATITPSSINFGEMTVGFPTANQTITFASSGTAPYRISSLVQAASSPVCPGSGVSICTSGDFICSTSCLALTDYANGTSCTITARLQPNTAGALSTNLFVCDNTSATARPITFTGTGVAPLAVDITPSPFNFGPVLVGSQSAAQSFTLSNNRSSAAPIGTLTVTSPFVLASTTCATSIPAMSFCTASVRFQPTGEGPATGSMSLPVTSQGSTPASVTLQGTGTLQADLAPIPASLDFGSFALNSGTVNRSLSIMNNGNGPLVINAVTTAAPFAVQNPCPASIPPAGSCVITVSHPSTTYGNSNGTLTLSSNSVGGNRTVSLLANVNSVTYLMSPPSTDFGAQMVGVDSAIRTFSLTNSGQNSLPIGVPAATGDFRVGSTTCGSGLAPMSSCDTTVIFRPTATGPLSGAVSIPVSLQNAPAASAGLAGNGIEQAVFTLPTSVDFGASGLGGVTVARSVEIRNSGNVPLAISGILATGPFIVANTCPASLAPAAACMVNLSFPPLAFGPATGLLSVSTNAPGGTRTVSLLASVNTIPYTMSPTQTDFGLQAIGTESAPRSFNLSNSAPNDIPLGTMTAPANFRVVSTTCAGKIPANSSCVVEASFKPTQIGPINGPLTVPVNMGNAPMMVATLQGTGGQASLALPPALDLGVAILGSGPLSGAIEVRNTGNVALAIGSIAATSPFQASHTCPTSLAPNAACSVSVGFTPLAFGNFNGTLTVASNAPGSPHTVALSAAVQSVPYTITPAQSDFGSQRVGIESAARSFQLSNAADAALPLGAVTTSGPFRVVSTTCGSTLAARSSCAADVAFNPTATGAASGVLSIAVTFAGAPAAQANLLGNGIVEGDLSLPTGIDFGTAMLASNPLRQTLEIRNAGNGNLQLTSITASAPFEVSSACPASLAPGAACVVSLSFPPLVYGNTTGQLTIASNSAGGNRVITLLATVAGVPYGISPVTADFGTQLVGTRSTTREFIISNNGDSAIPLARVTTTGPFRVASSNCGASLASRSSCTADVSFDPVQSGLASGVVMAEVSLTGAPPARAGLAGTGLQQPGLALPTSIDFGTVTLGSSTALTQTLELRNTGNAVLTFTIAVSGPFTLASNCGLNLPPGGACTVVVTFTPATVGEFTGSMAVVSNAPGGSRSIALIARVQPRPAPNIRVTPSFIGFGDRILGTLSAPQRLTITNDGGTAATLGPLASSPHYIINSQCGATLAPQASCTADIVFRPFVIGPRAYRLEIISNAPSSPNFIDLLGRGCSFPRPGVRPRCD